MLKTSTWPSSKGQTSEAQKSIRNNLWNKSYQILMEKMVELLIQDIIIIDLPARCVGQNINLFGTYIIDLGNVPAIISA